MRTIAATEVERCVDEAIAICKIASPTGDEGLRAAHVEDELHRAGWQSFRDSAGNVLARHPSCALDDRPHLLVAAHLDTVFSGLDHVKVERSDTTVRGPGIADNSLGVAGLLWLARRFMDDGKAGGLLLAATVGEEGLGNLRGAKQAVRIFRPREMIALEGGGLEAVVCDGVGSLRARLVLRGPGGHSWEARELPSASLALVNVLAECARDGVGESFNIGRLRADNDFSMIADRARADIEFRSHDGKELELAERLVQERTADATIEPLSGSVQILGRRPGGHTSKDHPLVRQALEARRLTSLPEPHLASVSTDANAGMAAGIPSISVSLADSEGAHSLDESVDIRRLPKGLEALGRLVAARLAVATNPRSSMQDLGA